MTKLCLIFFLSALEFGQLICNITGVVLVRANPVNTAGLCQFLHRRLPREKIVR